MEFENFMTNQQQDNFANCVFGTIDYENSEYYDESFKPLIRTTFFESEDDEYKAAEKARKNFVKNFNGDVGQLEMFLEKASQLCALKITEICNYTIDTNQNIMTEEMRKKTNSIYTLVKKNLQLKTKNRTAQQTINNDMINHTKQDLLNTYDNDTLKMIYKYLHCNIFKMQYEILSKYYTNLGDSVHYNWTKIER